MNEVLELELNNIVHLGIRKKMYKLIKRMFDIFASLLAIILFFPIFLLISILIKIDSKGNVINKYNNFLNKFRNIYVDNYKKLINLVGKSNFKKKLIEENKPDELHQFINQYVDLDGKTCERRMSKKIIVVLFAGIKFLFDRCLALFGLLIASPLMLLISIAIKIDSKGSILFKQERTGKNGKKFNIYKFRTMVANNDVHDFSTSDQHTKIGRVLRATSLDEIPQLFSILIGKMSFIGPRPWISDYYENMNDIQRTRCNVRPGLTGLAQVNGRNNITIFDKINYDLEYIKNYSFTQDIKIIFLTVKIVFIGTGADAGKETIANELRDLKQQNKVKKANG